MSLRLPDTLQAWGRSDFARVLHAELLRQDALFAPLQRGMRHGSHALVEQAVLMPLPGRRDDAALQFDVAVHYASITPGCACEADPTPMSELPECATLRIRILQPGAEATLLLMDD